MRLTLPKLSVIIIIAAVTSLRIFIGVNIPIHLDPTAGFDDLWMIVHSDIKAHFLEANSNSLIKTISYPLLIQIANILHIPYRLMLCILWIVSAFLVTLFTSRLTKNRAILILVYIFVLYCPVAFFTNIGGHLYRNAIVPPVVFIVLALLLLVSHQLIGRRKNFKTGLVYSFMLGIAFLFFYYIKEDSVWLLPIFVTMLGVSAVSLFLAKLHPVNGKDRLRYLILAIIPVLIFIGGTNVYKAVNLHYFGVFEINTRTEGAFADFSSRLFKISDENKTALVWLPFSTFEKAWSVSPTLQKHPDILENLRTSAWAHGDIEEYPIQGDLVLWAFRGALRDGGMYESERQVADFLESAAREIDEAFDNGSLEKETGKIYLSKAARGRTIQEILQVVPRIKVALKYHALYRDYTVVRIPRETEESNPDLSGRHDIVEGLVLDSLPTMDTYSKLESRLAVGASKLIIKAYQIIALFALPLSIAGFIILVFGVARKHQGASRFILLTMAMLIVSTLALMLGVAWFSEWLSDLAIAMYSVGAVPMIQLFEILGILCLLRFYDERRKGEPIFGFF